MRGVDIDYQAKAKSESCGLTDLTSLLNPNQLDFENQG